MAGTKMPCFAQARGGFMAAVSAPMMSGMMALLEAATSEPSLQCQFDLDE